MTDEQKALVERLREWPMREQVETYDHTFHIAETGNSYTTKRVIPQSPKPVMHEAADTIEKLEAENAALREALGFYADWGVVSPHYDDAVHLDSGDIARAALGETP